MGSTFMAARDAKDDSRRRANLRLGGILAAVVLAFFFGVIIYGLRQ